MDELKPCDITLLKKRLKSLSAGLENMDNGDIMVNRAMLTACRDYMAELLALRRAAPASWAADTLEKLIPEIEDSMTLVECQRVALHDAVTALRRTAPENKPLTVEQLRQMEGNPVYLVTNTELKNFWALVEKAFTDKVKLTTTDHDHILMLHLDAVKSGSVKLYARKPEGSEKP